MVPDTYPDLFWSYTAVWCVVVVYIVILGARVGRLERTISASSGKRK
jgi:CcmD family protein